MLQVLAEQVPTIPNSMLIGFVGIGVGVFLSITLPFGKTLPEYNDILDAVVEIFEIEVGNKSYNPNILSKDKASTYWLYKAKYLLNNSFCSKRWRLFKTKPSTAE